jgi:hypothetical protein
MEHKLNLPPFHIGQKVEYITGYNMPKGTIKVVQQILQFPCGCWKIGFGEPPQYNSLNSGCTDHGSCVSLLGWQHWDSTSFRAIQESPHPSLTFTQIKEVEKEEILLPN